jgi:HK97 gp10 family phage protein
MSVEFFVEVSGVEDFAAKMETLDGAMQERVQDALNQTAQQVVYRARELAPVRTGRLMSSIYAQIILKWVVKVACIVPYAWFQEFGTRYIAPRYFMTRALTENFNNLLSIVCAALQKAAEDAGLE